MTRNNEESALQQSVVIWLQIQENLGRLTYFSIPNNPRNAVTGSRLKREGMRAGTPDLQILAKNLPPLFLELKAEKGKLSMDQKIAAGRLTDQGAIVCVCRTLGEAQGMVHAWMNAREAA